MTNEKQAKMLEKVRALLAKADSTSFPAEAESFRAKADELMTAYAIEAWQVEAGHESERPQPESRMFGLDWYYRNPRADEVWQLFHAVASHCRVTVVWWTAHHECPVVGLPADLDYLDMLFTSLLLEMGKGLEPKPNESETVDENAYRLRSAGMDWYRLTGLLWEAGMIDLPKGVMEDRYGNLIDSATPWARIDYKIQTTMKNRIASRTRDHRRKHDLPDYTRSHPSVYQRSFALGFVREIRARFRLLREQAAAPARGGTGMEVALRDIAVVVRDAAVNEFGEEPKARGRAVGNVRITDEGIAAGREAGAKADLSNAASRRVGSRKVLER